MFKKLSIIFLATLFLVSCAGKPDFDLRVQTPASKEYIAIDELELDGDPIIIAVYDFLDMTGQKKPGGNFASMSTAVTQGSYQILIKAMADAGNGKWFRIVERASLPSLLQERKLIRSTRQMADGDKAEPLPALLFAGAYITGGIVGYDSDTKSGGVGARILGIQDNAQYRQDVVTIILRLINVQTGEVVVSITIEKTIFSTSKGADIFKYFDADTMLLEVEAGVARNEPVTFAVRKAIEAGVAEIIREGAVKELWKFKEPIKPVNVEESDEETVTKEKVTHNLKLEQGKPEKVKTRAEYLAEKKAKKELLLAEKKAKIDAIKAEKKAKKDLKKVQKNELGWYNEQNNTDFKTYSAYQEHLKVLLAFENKAIYIEERRNKIRKAALEVKDESISIDTNTATSNND
jgi:curli production assembly/transport component CsgG